MNVATPDPARKCKPLTLVCSPPDPSLTKHIYKRYWDWTLDNTALLKSPVMSSDLGFGGDGSTNRTETSANGGVLKCVDSGPFAQLRPEWLQINPTTMLGGGHCLYRGMPEVSEPDAFAAMSKVISPEYIDEMQTTGNWSEYRYLLEGGPHGTIHASLGGEMNPTTSPNGSSIFLDFVPSNTSFDITFIFSMVQGNANIGKTNPQSPSSSCTTLRSTASGGCGSSKTPRA